MSSRSFNAAWLVGAVVLSSWAISSASDQAARPPAAQPEPVLTLPAVSADVDAQISRLAAWNQSVAAPTTRRNPFKFENQKIDVASAPQARTPEARAINLTPAPVEVVVRPALSAIAEQKGTRVAVISFNDALHYVKQGDVVAGRYRVDSVGADAVEVFDLTLGTILKLTLQSLT